LAIYEDAAGRLWPNRRVEGHLVYAETAPKGVPVAERLPFD
jgi:hypothetical protein